MLQIWKSEKDQDKDIQKNKYIDKDNDFCQIFHQVFPPKLSH